MQNSRELYLGSWNTVIKKPLFWRVTIEQLHAAIAALPDKQAKRIYAHYFLGMSKSAIARTEGVSKAVVGEAIGRGLRNM